MCVCVVVSLDVWRALQHTMCCCPKWLQAMPRIAPMVSGRHLFLRGVLVLTACSCNPCQAPPPSPAVAAWLCGLQCFLSQLPLILCYLKGLFLLPAAQNAHVGAWTWTCLHFLTSLTLPASLSGISGSTRSSGAFGRNWT